MRILFEDYHYERGAIPKLDGIESITLKDGRVKLPYVGYYRDASQGALFILPKVFITKDQKALGRYSPEELIDTSVEDSPLTPEHRSFLFKVSTWLYQAIALFNARHAENEITLRGNLAGVIGARGEGEATLLDYVLAHLRFSKEHQHLFLCKAIIQHSGASKIHWTKTIRQSQALLHGGTPFYLDCKTKSKVINSDEELIVLFFSTLEYLAQSYHFPVKKPLYYELIKAHRIASLIETGKGTRLLRKFRSKYFSDELVALWRLLYVFYEQAEQVAQNKEYRECLLVRSFNIVFEDMVDALIGEGGLPLGLKEQKDGKIIHHIYRDRSLLGDGDIYFIGDSKYYKEENEVGEQSLYKQFTYAKNVIQYHIDMLNRGQYREELDRLPYRDELTEGYNLTPNFFIRGSIDPNNLSYSDSQLKAEEVRLSYHFPNRLFDRDTLFVQTYSINLLYVLSSYVQRRGAINPVNKQLR